MRLKSLSVGVLASTSLRSGKLLMRSRSSPTGSPSPSTSSGQPSISSPRPKPSGLDANDLAELAPAKKSVASPWISFVCQVFVSSRERPCGSRAATLGILRAVGMKRWRLWSLASCSVGCTNSMSQGCSWMRLKTAL